MSSGNIVQFLFKQPYQWDLMGADFLTPTETLPHSKHLWISQSFLHHFQRQHSLLISKEELDLVIKNLESAIFWDKDYPMVNSSSWSSCLHFFQQILWECTTTKANNPDYCQVFCCSSQTGGKSLLLKTTPIQLIEHREVKTVPTSSLHRKWLVVMVL